MTGLAWKKVYELTQGYPPEFNVAAAHKLVLAAWQMGFDLVRDPQAPQRYLDDIRHESEQYRQARGFDSGLSNQLAMNARLPSK